MHIDSLDSHAGRLAVFGRRTGDTFNKIYASADNGVSWQEMSGPTNRLLWANREISLDPWRTTQIWVFTALWTVGPAPRPANFIRRFRESLMSRSSAARFGEMPDTNHLSQISRLASTLQS